MTGNKLQSDNLDQELKDFGIGIGNSIRKQTDVSVDLGGRLIRNKLWFYGAVRHRDISRSVLGAYSEVEPPDTKLDNIVTAKYVTQKYSYQANSSHRFVFFNLWEHLRENAKMDSLRSWEAREDKSTAHPIMKWGWEGQFSRRGRQFPVRVRPARFGRAVPEWDWDTPEHREREPRYRGDPRARTSSAARTRGTPLHQTKGAVTYYKSNWAGGNHEFKVGGEYARNKNFRSLSGKSVNYHLLYDGEQRDRRASVCPFAVAFFNADVFPDGRQNTTSFFGRDSWTLGRRLTLNLGVRFAKTIAYAPEQTRTAASGPSTVIFPAETFPRIDLNTWNSVEPRLHAAFDITGDGKTVVKGG